MALIIDFRGKEPPKETPKPTPVKTEKPLVKDGKPSYEQCKHHRCLISEEQRTVTCQDCAAAVDPIAYILLLYRQYETRIDSRVYEIREFEKREQERREREQKRKAAPRRAKVERRAVTAERAAYNRYQAELLTLRAARQEHLVATLDAEIAALPPGPLQTDPPRV